MRLTRLMRSAIASKVVDAATAKDKARMEKERHALAVRVFNWRYSTKEQALLHSLPKGFVPEVMEFCATTAKNNTAVTLRFGKPTRMTYADSRDIVVRNSAIEKRIVQLDKAGTKFWENRRALRKMAFEAMSGHTSTTTLVKAWPEVAKIVAGIAGAEKIVKKSNDNPKPGEGVPVALRAALKGT